MSAHAMHHGPLTRIIRKSALSINIVSPTPRFIRASSIAPSSSPAFFHTRATNPPRIIITTSTTIPKPATQRQRQFSSSASLSKKKDKNKQKNDEAVAEPNAKNSGSAGGDASSAAAPDPFDLTQLHDGISDALARLKDDLQKLRSGGRLNPEVIENLRVSVDKNSNETVKLGELAQVVPKGGRSVAIIVGEEEVSDIFIISISFLSNTNPVAARQVSQLSHHRLQPVINAAARRTQCSPIKRAHPSAHKGISRPGSENGQDGYGKGCQFREEFARQYTQTIARHAKEKRGASRRCPQGP
jgi:hypothetical protein